MKLAKILRKINKERSAIEITDANAIYFIEKYQEVLDECTPNDKDEYLTALLNIMYIARDDECECIELCFDYSYKALDYLKSEINDDTITRQTELGQLQAEVIREASSNIAWYGRDRTDDTKKLEEYLNLINLGCNYIYSDDEAWMHDVKVRVLLKLNRHREAYRIVSDVLATIEDFDRFDDIKDTPDYLNWMHERINNPVICKEDLLSDEIEFLNKAERITRRLAAEIENKKLENFIEKIPDRQIISHKDAFEKYKTYFYTDDEDKKILVFDGDLCINETLSPQWYKNQLKDLKWEGYLNGMLVTGDLTINGDLTDDEYLKLVVLGRLKCDYVYSCYGEININSSATIKYGIYGQFWKGWINVENDDVDCPYFWGGDHNMPWSSNSTEFICIEKESEYSLYDVNIDKLSGGGYLLLPSVCDESKEFSFEKLISLVRQGKNPFKTIKDK